MDTDKAAPSRPTVTERTKPWWAFLQRHLLRLLELLALTGLAIAQPLLEVTGQAPDFFLFHRATRLDMLVLLAAIVLLPPGAIWMLELLSGLVSEALAHAVHLLAVAALVGVLALQVGKELLPLRGAGLLALAAAGGVLGGVARARWRPFSLWLRYLSPVPLIFVLLFVLATPAGRLVQPSRHEVNAGPTAPAGDRPPVVMVVFDEFPLQLLLDSQGRIDRRLYPNLAAFASDATFYRNATGVNGYTPAAVPSLLTGRYPGPRAAPTFEEYPNNLFVLLGTRYDIVAYESVTKLCPVERCPTQSIADGTFGASNFRGMVRGTAGVLQTILAPHNQGRADVEQYLGVGPSDDQFLFNRLSDNQVDRWEAFQESLRPQERPRLTFLHVLLPHRPTTYFPSGTRYNGRRVSYVDEQGADGAALYSLMRQRLMLQTGFVDKLVGELMRHLKDQGLYDKSLIVLTADHGNGLTPGEPERGVGPTNAPESAWVPMLLKRPGQTEGKVDDRNWEQVDLLPTIADIVDIEVPWPIDGNNQNGPPARPPGPKRWSGYEHPEEHRTIKGPANFRKVLAGHTDRWARPELGPIGLFYFGRFADLVGKPPSAVGPVTGDPVPAELIGAEDFEEVDLSSGFVPALVDGNFSEAPPPGSSVLVAINGKIAGESGVYRPRQRDAGTAAARFAVICPEQWFHAGPGLPQIEAFLVDRSGATPTLRPISLG